jgi:hypothetical protein
MNPYLIRAYPSCDHFFGSEAFWRSPSGPSGPRPTTKGAFGGPQRKKDKDAEWKKRIRDFAHHRLPHQRRAA